MVAFALEMSGSSDEPLNHYNLSHFIKVFRITQPPAEEQLHSFIHYIRFVFSIFMCFTVKYTSMTLAFFLINSERNYAVVFIQKGF